MNAENSFINCKFYTLNVKGIRDRSKREGVLSWSKDKAADIVFLQETFSTKDIEGRWSSMWDGLCFYSHGTSHSKGVMVLIAASLDIVVNEVVSDCDGRYVVIDCTIQGLRVRLCNVYFPTRNKERDQIQFLRKLSRVISKLGNYPLVMGGDFNMIRNIELDYFGHSKSNVLGRFNREFEEFMQELRLQDVWRIRYPSKKQFTYTQKNPYMQSRLDYWLVYENLEEASMRNCTLHCPRSSFSVFTSIPYV